MITLSNINEVCETVVSLPRVTCAVAGRRPSFSADANVSLAGLSGILEYLPEEFTFTALAGHPCR